MKYWMILVALALCVTPPAAAESAVAPVFFAVSVADLDASVKWYTEMLDLNATRLPEGKQAKIALLQGDGIVVELIEHTESFDVATRVPELEKRYLAHGVFKVGFFVTDLDSTVARLSKRGATFKGKAFTDKVLGARTAQLLDNSGNIIQLFERLNGR